VTGGGNLVRVEVLRVTGMEPDQGELVMGNETKANAILWVLGATLAALLGVGLVSFMKGQSKADELKEARIKYCFGEVRVLSRYPSKAVLLGTSELSVTRISGRAEFMNGFGAMIPHRFECEFYSSSSDSVKGSPQLAEGG
jgi:hypothetical protein